MSSIWESGALLADQAHRAIRSRILDCRIAPGSVVSERRLAEEFGFGMAPVRAALARLSSEGMVTAAPRVGYRVAPITLGRVTTFFEAWSIIAPELARLAMQRLSDADRQRLLEVEPLTDASSPEEIVAFADHQWQILQRAADNAVLTEISVRLQLDLHRIFLLSYRHADATGAPRPPLPSTPHGEPDEVRDALRDYIASVREHVVRMMVASSPVADAVLAFES